MKIENWEIKESKNNLKEVIYEVYEELICDFEENTMNYYHGTFSTLKSALNYIAERVEK